MRRMALVTSLLGLLLIGCDGDAAPAAARSGVDNPAPLPATPKSVATPAHASRDKPVAAALPADVVAFRKRRDQCDHFRGEEPGDETRAAELEKALERTCRGTDAQLAGLRRKYSGEPAVIAALRGYEDQVE